MGLNDEQTILYAMFILRANHRSWKSFVKNLSGRDEDFCMFAMMIYADLFADRGVAEEEHEAYVPDAIFAMLGSGMQPKIYSEYNPIYPHKIKFRFVDEE